MAVLFQNCGRPKIKDNIEPNMSSKGLTAPTYTEIIDLNYSKPVPMKATLQLGSNTAEFKSLNIKPAFANQVLGKIVVTRDVYCFELFSNNIQKIQLTADEKEISALSNNSFVLNTDTRQEAIDICSVPENINESIGETMNVFDIPSNTQNLTINFPDTMMQTFSIYFEKDWVLPDSALDPQFITNGDFSKYQDARNAAGQFLINAGFTDMPWEKYKNNTDDIYSETFRVQTGTGIITSFSSGYGHFFHNVAAHELRYKDINSNSSLHNSGFSMATINNNSVTLTSPAISGADYMLFSKNATPFVYQIAMDSTNSYYNLSLPDTKPNYPPTKINNNLKERVYKFLNRAITTASMDSNLLTTKNQYYTTYPQGIKDSELAANDTAYRAIAEKFIQYNSAILPSQKLFLDMLLNKKVTDGLSEYRASNSLHYYLVLFGAFFSTSFNSKTNITADIDGLYSAKTEDINIPFNNFFINRQTNACKSDGTQCGPIYAEIDVHTAQITMEASDAGRIILNTKFSNVPLQTQ